MSEKNSRRKLMLYIWCRDADTYRAFKRYAADYRNYEEALRSLLEKAGVVRERAPVF